MQHMLSRFVIATLVLFSAAVSHAAEVPLRVSLVYGSTARPILRAPAVSMMRVNASSSREPAARYKGCILALRERVNTACFIRLSD
jgi:hypothetical protein